MKKIFLIGSFIWIPVSSYYPGSPDKNLSVLQTTEVTENKHLFTRFNHRFEDPVFPDGESNPFYHFYGFDGGANIYLDVGMGFMNLFEVTLSRQRFDKVYGLEGKAQILNQRVDPAPFSLSVGLNTQYKTDRSVATHDRYSAGALLAATFATWRDKLDFVFNQMVQSNVTPDNNSAEEVGYASGIGLLFRVDRLSLFGEWTIPYGRRNPNSYLNSILESYGANYRIFNHSFALMISNSVDIHSVNWMNGPLARDKWLNSMRIGFNITRTFKLMH